MIRSINSLLWSLCALIGSVTIFSSPLCGQQKRVIQILVTSDIHGWMSTSFVYPNRKRRGLLHIARHIESKRRENPKLILLDAGDLLQGSPLVFFYNQSPELAKRNPFFQLFQSLQYDAVSVGNHDLAINPLLEQVYYPDSSFSWLSANITRRKKQLFKPYIILRRDRLKIAIVGFTTPGSMMWIDPERLNGIEINSVTDSAAFWIKRVNSLEHPDLIIGLFHVGVNALRDNENSKLNNTPEANSVKSVLERIQGFDLLITGHDHRLSPGKTGETVPYYQHTPVIRGGWQAGFLMDLKLHLTRTKEKWKISFITSELRQSIQDISIDRSYRRLLSDSYKQYMRETLPWVFSKTTIKHASNCFNTLNSMANNTHLTDGTALPKLKIDGIRKIIGRKIERLDLFRWFHYHNRPFTIKVSRRDIYLLSNPIPIFGRGKISYNRQLFLRLNPGIQEPTRSNWFLDRSQFIRRYSLVISDYHYFGGGGIIAPLFLDRSDLIHKENTYLKDRLFSFLKSRQANLPRVCGFLKFSN